METSRFSEERALKDKKRFERNAKESKANPIAVTMAKTDEYYMDLEERVVTDEKMKKAKTVYYLSAVIIVAVIAATVGTFNWTIFKWRQKTFIEILVHWILNFALVGLVSAIPISIIYDFYFRVIKNNYVEMKGLEVVNAEIGLIKEGKEVNLLTSVNSNGYDAELLSKEREYYFEVETAQGTFTLPVTMDEYVDYENGAKVVIYLTNKDDYINFMPMPLSDKVTETLLESNNL